MELGRIVQVAYDVSDEGDVRAAAARHAARFGSGPFFVNEHIPLRTVRHNGEDATFDHSSAYGQSGGVMVELVCQHRVEPPSLRHQLRQRGSGIHHVAFFVEQLDAEVARLESLGYGLSMMATTSSGRRFAFHDAVADLGHLLEIYELDDGLRRFYSMVADAAAGWDGLDPVRFR